MDSLTEELIKECKRQVENCLYTSTSLFVWLRFLRSIRVIFISVPLVLGSIAGWSLLSENQDYRVRWFTAVCALIGGILPMVYSGLKIDDHLESCKRLAAEYKNLQDRFRRAALISSQKDFAVFEQDVAPIFERLEAARTESVTPPEWCFRRAQEKVKKGHYDFNSDSK